MRVSLLEVAAAADEMKQMKAATSALSAEVLHVGPHSHS